MFIYIDSSICELLDENTNITLGNLASAHRDGKHFIFAKLSTLRYIIDNADIHDRERSIYKIIYAQYPQLAGMLTLLSTYVLVTSSTLIARREENANQTILRVPINSFRDSSALEPVNIIGEDLSDVDFYSLLAKAYASSKKIRSNFSFFPVPGGGNGTGVTYNTHQCSSKLALCIVDSDIKAENCGLGDTAKIVERNDNTERLLSTYYIINIHEAENMIPLKILEEVCVTADDNSSFAKIQSNKENNLTKYIDYKNQLKLSSILEHNNPCYKNYWKDTMYILAPNKNIVECIANQNECIIFNGFGDGILTKAITAMSHKSSKKLAEDCNSIIHMSEWENISKLILSWSFSPPPISA